MNIRDKFSSEAVLKESIQKNIQYYVDEIKDSLGYLEVTYKKAKKDRLIGTSMYVGGFWFLIVVFNVNDFIRGFSYTHLNISTIIGCLLIFLGYLKGRGTAQTIRDFDKKLNQRIFIEIFKLFGLSGKMIGIKDDLTQADNATKFFNLFRHFPTIIDQAKFEIVKQEFDSSELITESHNRVEVDDIFCLHISDKKLFVSELDVKHVTGSGKNRRVKNIFYGYFFSLELNKTLKAKTFVSSENDKFGFGHQSLLGDNKGISVTELEWNDFENKLHVVSSDPVEARYILTTNFMSDLYDWWKEEERHIRLSFIGNKMCVLYPDKRIRLNKTIKEISVKEMNEYMESIAIPLLHVLYLVEDVQENHG